MENWFNDNPFFSGKNEKKGIDFTQTLKSKGFVSLNEYDGFEYVLRKISRNYIGNDSLERREIKRKRHDAITKQQQLDFINEMGMGEELERVLEMSPQERVKEELNYFKENFLEMKRKGEAEEEIIKEQLANYEQKHK